MGDLHPLSTEEFHQEEERHTRELERRIEEQFAHLRRSITEPGGASVLDVTLAVVQANVRDVALMHARARTTLSLAYFAPGKAMSLEMYREVYGLSADPTTSAFRRLAVASFDQRMAAEDQQLRRDLRQLLDDAGVAEHLSEAQVGALLNQVEDRAHHHAEQRGAIRAALAAAEERILATRRITAPDAGT